MAIFKKHQPGRQRTREKVLPDFIPNNPVYAESTWLLLRKSPESYKIIISFVSFSCSVARSCPILCELMDCITPGFPVLHYLSEFAQTHVHWVSDAIQPSHPLLSPFPSVLIFPSIRVFSNELTLHIRWPKYWSFSFSISPSNEYSRKISFRIELFDLLAVQGTLKSSPAP